MKGLLIVGLIGVGILVSGFVYMGHDKPKYQIRYDYTVRYGDTLWDVAAKNAPDDMDIREYMFNLHQINGENITDIKPGQVITLYR